MENYDIFISHKKEQLSWAIRLQETLKRFGYNCFVDHSTENNLKAGMDWETQLEHYCKNANYMIVLWSERIHNASYVHKEIEWRIEVCKNDSTKQLIIFPLDDPDSAPFSNELRNYYGKKQFFRGLIDHFEKISDKLDPNYKKTRDEGADLIEHRIWNEIIRKFVEEELVKHDSLIEIPYITLAMNKLQATDILDGRNLSISKSVYKNIFKSLKKFNSFDINRYGDTNDDWKPLPVSSQYKWDLWTISDIINFCDSEKRSFFQKNKDFVHLNNYRFNRYFVPYTSQLFDSDTHRQSAMDILSKSPCLVFIDPVSLMHKSVRKVFNYVMTFENPLILGLSPFIPILHNDFTEYVKSEKGFIEDVGLGILYDRFHRFFEESLKTSIMNIDHGYELARWIQFATDNIMQYRSDKKETFNKAWNSNSNLRKNNRKPPIF